MATDELAAARIFLRPIANPYALGFFGLAGASFVVSGVELGWVHQHDVHQAALVLLVFAPLLQTISCVFGFLARDPVAASGMGTLGATWACIGLVLLTIPPGSTSKALGILLLLAAGAVFVAAASASLSKLVAALVIGSAGARFALTAIHQLTGIRGWEHASGYAGLVVGAVAFYGAASFELEGLLKRPVLPTGRHGPGTKAFQEGFPHQVDNVSAEAGVRKML